MELYTAAGKRSARTDVRWPVPTGSNAALLVEGGPVCFSATNMYKDLDPGMKTTTLNDIKPRSCKAYLQDYKQGVGMTVSVAASAVSFVDKNTAMVILSGYNNPLQTTSL